MPELAEVEHARRFWHAAALGQRVREVVITAPRARVFRGTDVDALGALAGKALVGSAAKGKQMAFRFGRGGSLWLGLHLGMSGRLGVEVANHEPAKHEHLLLRLASQTLVYSDPRHFGRVLFYEGEGEPPWWSKIAPSVLSDAFSEEAVATFLDRRRRAPLKAVLLMQERFPGIGNWMADEILWRARLHPSTTAGALDRQGARALWRTVRQVAQLAVETIDDSWGYPASWLFPHRWEAGGRCPRCRTALLRATVGGRTTCWCPRCQGEAVVEGRAAKASAAKASILKAGAAKASVTRASAAKAGAAKAGAAKAGAAKAGAAKAGVAKPSVAKTKASATRSSAAKPRATRRGSGRR
jgi:formamidopyrimidine-DNA glycosylase